MGGSLIDNQRGPVTVSQRFKQVGAFVTTVESIMFELMQDKNHPRFREVSALAKGRGEAPALLSHL